MATNITAGQLDATKLDSWKGQPVLDSQSKKVGQLTDIYVDDGSIAPRWAVISSGGMFGDKIVFAPIGTAVHMSDGIHLTVAKADIDKAPEVNAIGSLTPADEAKLKEHYQISASSEGQDDPADQENTAPIPETISPEKAARNLDAEAGPTSTPAPLRTDLVEAAEPAPPLSPQQPGPAIITRRVIRQEVVETTTLAPQTAVQDN